MHATILIAYDVDGEQLCVDITVLIFIPYLAPPLTVTLERLPQCLIKGLVMSACNG
jgi:hypothetical protein